MSHPINLTALTPREAVADALYRAVIGLDTNDAAMFESAWDKTNARFERSTGAPLVGMDAINKELFGLVSTMETHHTIGTVRVDIKDNGKTAYMTCYALAQHHRAGEGADPTKKGLLGGTTYFVDLVKDNEDGLWKMTKWALQLNWSDGDISVIITG